MQLRRLLLWATVTLIAIHASLSSACEQPLKTNIDHWPPYSFMDSDQPTGLEIELVSAIINKAGCTLKFLHVPPARSHYMLRKGHLDLLMAASKSPDREKYAMFTVPYRQEIIQLFTLRTTPPLPPMESMQDIQQQGNILLAPSHGWYGNEYENAKPALQQNKQLLVYRKYPYGLHMLLKGRGDLLIGDLYATLYQAQKQDAQDQIQVLPWVVHDNPIHLMLSRKTLSPDDLTQINQAITALDKDGTLAAILARYQMLSN